MLTVLCLSLSGLLKLIVYLTLTVFVFFIGIRLWVEPIKGVCKCKTRLENKVALVTGGNSGIGLETARDLARRGARVIIASSNDRKSKIAVEDIVDTTGNTNVEYKHLDLSKFSSIREFAEDFNKTVDRLDILVNNAGTAGLKGPTEDGIEKTMQINYLGPFLLTLLLTKKLIESKPSRIVIVSSFGHRLTWFDPNDLPGLKTYFDWIRYANTKLCNVLWTKALSKRLPIGVTVNTLHPGIVTTDIFNNLHPIIKNLLSTMTNILFKTPKEGAQTTIHLSVCPSLENVTGEYFEDCKISDVSQKARDSDLAEKVWNDSVELTKHK